MEPTADREVLRLEAYTEYHFALEEQYADQAGLSRTGSA